MSGRVLVVGAMGRMGERIRAALEGHERLSLGAALEAPGHPALGSELASGVRLGEDAGEALAAADVAIVFATPDATLSLLRLAADAGVPCAVGTTGFSAAQKKEIEALAERVGIVLAANFSVAVNVLFHLARSAAELLGPGFDAEIFEIHHSAKVDAPSGTALRIGEAVAEGRGQGLEEHAVLAREGLTGPRPDSAIGIQTLRGGDNPGEHTLMFVGAGERLELVHRSATRDHFAHGAVRAAAWLAEQGPGLYDMEQVLGLGNPD
jgi:4-hydroxy-tetrahydrodipicolinate reductase